MTAWVVPVDARQRATREIQKVRELTHSDNGRQKWELVGGAKRAALYAIASESVIAGKRVGMRWTKCKVATREAKRKMAVQEMPRLGGDAQRLLTVTGEARRKSLRR